MEYGKPQKLPDGRYFLKITGVSRQVNDLVLQDPLENKTVNFKVSEGTGPIWRVMQIRVRGGAATPIPKEYMFTDDPEDDDPADYLD